MCLIKSHAPCCMVCSDLCFVLLRFPRRFACVFVRKGADSQAQTASRLGSRRRDSAALWPGDGRADRKDDDAREKETRASVLSLLSHGGGRGWGPADGKNEGVEERNKNDGLVTRRLTRRPISFLDMIPSGDGGPAWPCPLEAPWGVMYKYLRPDGWGSELVSSTEYADRERHTVLSLPKAVGWEISFLF